MGTWTHVANRLQQMKGKKTPNDQNQLRLVEILRTELFTAETRSGKIFCHPVPMVRARHKSFSDQYRKNIVEKALFLTGPG